jgi:hypothetical protein
MNSAANHGTPNQEAPMATTSFVSPLVLPVLSVEPAAFVVGDIVENFGGIGRVVAVDSQRGLTLRSMGPRRGFKWIADPSKCFPVR